MLPGLLRVEPPQEMWVHLGDPSQDLAGQRKTHEGACLSISMCGPGPQFPLL